MKQLFSRSRISSRNRFNSTLLSTGLVFSLLLTSQANSDTLEQIYELALENDAQLRADRAAYEAGKESYNIGRASLLPSISGSGSYSKSEGNSEGTRYNTFTSTAQDFDTDDGTTRTTWGANLTQPLFNMAAWYGFKQGKIGNESAEATFSANQQTFLLRVAEGYFNVLRAIDNLETSLAEEKALSSQLEQTKQRFEVGLTAITDVHDSQAAFDSATATTLQSRGQLGIAFEALEVLTGQPAMSVAPIAENFPVTNPTPLDRQEWVNFALENNYSLKKAKLNADNLELASKVSKSGHLPTLSTTISYSNTDSDTTAGVKLPDSVTDTTSVTLNLNIPIFSGGATTSRSRQAYQNYIQAKELYNNAQRNTIQSARSSHLLVETSVATVKARQQAIISSQSALEATQAGYEVGTRTLVDLLLSQRSLYQAQRAYYTALYDYILNTLRLKEAAGLLGPQDILELNQHLEVENQVSRAQYER
ncbi:MAG: TolC family outer membrane protein [Cellvibrionaceae bacterium]